MQWSLGHSEKLWANSGNQMDCAKKKQLCFYEGPGPMTALIKKTYNVCFKKTGTKHSSVLLQRFVPLFLKQTLVLISRYLFKSRGACSNRLSIFLSVLFSKPWNSVGALAPPAPPLSTALLSSKYWWRSKKLRSYESTFPQLNCFKYQSEQVYNFCVCFIIKKISE